MTDAPHPFNPMQDGINCKECGQAVDTPIHQPPLPMSIKCERGHVLPLTDAYRFVTCPWCQGKLTVQW